MANDGNTDTRGFGGLPVVTFESRRSTEMASLIERHGGAPIAAPALRELKIDDNPPARAFARALAANKWDVVILLTGVGTRALLDEIAPELDRPAFAAALGRATTVVRGPKPAQVLRELGVAGFVTVPEPNTWREIVTTLEARGPLAGLRVAVQEHGAPSLELYQALRDQGAHVTAVAVYKWALPEDTAPLRRALHALAEGRVRVALFTSRSQVEHAFAVAAEEQIEGAVKAALRRGVIASIGPVCTEALLAEGLTPDLEPTHSKMGHLVKESAAKASSILEAKDSSSASA
ncbi:MAG: uroporphyrinogen-III synthase [Byssovorax sp.]